MYCGKDKQPVPVRTLNKDFLSYIYFKEGSFWVYQDSITLFKDSVLALDNYIDTLIFEDNKGNIELKGEQFHYKLKQDKKILLFEGFKMCSSKDRNDIVCYLAYYRNVNNLEINSDIFFYPLLENAEEGGVTLTYFYDSLIVNNKTFYNVARMYRSQNEIEEGYETVFYFAKNVGIIRKEIEYQQGKWEIWNLVRYNIVQ